MQTIYNLILEQGINFEHDELYVEYKIEVPAGVHVNDENNEGCTHTSLAKSVEGNDIAIFSYNFSVQLLMDTKVTDDFFWPRILVKVNAEDLWGRYYIDGYGFTMLPQSPGRHTVTIPCWKPLDPLNKRAALFNYFVSQSIDIDHLKLGELLTQSKRVSRIGLATETSGDLKLNISCILQAKNFIPRDLLRQMTYNSAIKRAGLHSNLHWKIMKVLIEFEKAKSQFIETRNRFEPNSDFNTGTNHK
uniref:B9 domain-containing protein 1 n=1 Tax=Syphacia muris TaxID=451379 RepID=A0A0N5ABN7_9BILA